MSLLPITIEALQAIAESMNAQSLDIAPFKKMGFLVRYGSDEYRKRRENRVIMLGEIEVANERFVYFMA